MESVQAKLGCVLKEGCFQCPFVKEGVLTVEKNTPNFKRFFRGFLPTLDELFVVEWNPCRERGFCGIGDETPATCFSILAFDGHGTTCVSKNERRELPKESRGPIYREMSDI